MHVNVSTTVCSTHYTTEEDKLELQIADSVGDKEILFCIPSYQKYQSLLPPLCAGAEITLWHVQCIIHDTTESPISLLFDKNTTVCLHKLTTTEAANENDAKMEHRFRLHFNTDH